MRPIKLKMTAFGPYAKTVELNFDEGLGGENFFLIHGETGAGKTSILDAICYALYGDSSGGERNDKMLRATQAAASAVTEVEFEFALDDKFYTVRRRPALDAKTRRAAELFLNGRLLSGSYAEVDERIKDIIGLEIKQFRQVVLLPQGSFRKFLTSNPRERGEVLSLIFDADFYALIESRLKEKAAAAKKICDELSAQQKILTDSAREIGSLDAKILAENLAAAKSTLAQRTADLDSAVKNLAAAERLAEQFAACDTAKKNLDAARIELEKFQKSLDAAQVEYDTRKAEEPARLALEIEIASLEKISAALEELASQKSALANAQTAATSAEKNLRDLKATHKKYEQRLADLKQQETELQNADAELVSATQILKDARARQACLDEIARLEKNLDAAKITQAAASKNLERLKFVQRAGMAVLLAETLTDGEPCPVCGSTAHPNPAVSAEIIPSDKEIQAAERELTAANTAAAKVSASLENQRDTLKKFDAVPDLAAAQKNFDAAQKRAADLKTARANLRKGETYTKNIADEVDAAQKNLDAKTRAAATLSGTVDALTAQIPKTYAAKPEKISGDLSAKKKRKRELDTAWNTADKNFHSLNNLHHIQKGKVDNLHAAYRNASSKIDGQTAPELNALKTQKNLAQDSYTAAVAETATLENNLRRLTEISSRLADINAEISAAEKNFQIWGRLSDIANGAKSRLTFQRYYLDAIFADVIFAANERLERMSGGRYSFRGEKNAMSRKKLEGLNLEILDAYNGTARAIETLSGGESFLASLSLALGLAAVVKNTAGGIRLDTIFIDEGFGSLDSETLDVAMSALMDLQEGGRLVGIISHVDALKNRVPVRLEVTKTKTGSTARFVS